MAGYLSLASRRAFAIVATLLLFVGVFPMSPALAATAYSLSINDVAVTEGNAGTTIAAYTVALTPAAGANPVTVTAATSDGTAAAGPDYVANSQLLTFNPGQSTATFNVTVNVDTIDECAAYSYAVTLSVASVAFSCTFTIS